MKVRALIAAKLLTILVAVSLIGVSFSKFSDIETSANNTFQAGTLDLKVNNSDDPQIVTIALSNMKPGQDSGYYKFIVKNVGSLAGKHYVHFVIHANDDNNLTEPESACDSTGGAGQGELGQYLKYTIGWGPKTWNVPSQVISEWTTGPPNPWGTPGLNGLHCVDKNMTGVLNPGDEVAFFFKVSLDANLRIWDGTKWIEVNDNIIQSDSVRFSIEFHLDQV